MHGFWDFMDRYSPVLSPTSELQDEFFLVYSTLVGWISVATLGFASEFLVGGMLIDRIQSMRERQTLWKVANVAFPLFLFVALRATSVFGLPFLAIGLFKFGFPESLGYINAALEGDSVVQIAADLLNGIGTIVHHGATSFVIVAVSTGLFPLSRPLFAACLAPVLQHAAFLLKYYSMSAHVLVQLVLEVYFEWEVVCNISEFRTPFGLEVDRIGRGCALSMLLSHWMYLFAAILQAFVEKNRSRRTSLHIMERAVSDPNLA